MSLLAVKDLAVSFSTEQGRVKVLDNVSFDVVAGETLGIVGESGCGKTVTALAIMGLLPRPSGAIESGSILFEDTDLVRMPANERVKIRGNRIAMIFQEPATALNPVQTVGKQVGEVLRLHFPELSSRKVIVESETLLAKAGIAEPLKRLHDYPHQLSGGMRQRVMIAMALACKPDVLIADEPTTALDVTFQAQILQLMQDLQRDTGMAIIFITHDLGVVAELCDNVVVMYAGRIAERCGVGTLFADPRHPYSRGLLQSIPSLTATPKTPLPSIPGTVPVLGAAPSGCRFRNRCSQVFEPCSKHTPALQSVGKSHHVACHLCTA